VPGPGLRKKTQAQPWPWPWSMRARAVLGPRPFKGRAWAQALEGPALALEGPELKDLGLFKGRAWAQALEGPALQGPGPGPWRGGPCIFFFKKVIQKNIYHMPQKM